MSNTTSEQLSQFVECVFEPTDIVEIRRFPNKKCAWGKASELPSKAETWVAANRAGQTYYVGANPRNKMRGSKSGDVALARCLFADLDDGISVDETLSRIAASGLPLPTMLMATGHGCHAYWRLTEPITNLGEFTRLQKRLISVLGSDPVVHDPPRIMRLPGFLNLKYPSALVPCEVIDADAGRRYSLDEIRVILDAGDGPSDCLVIAPPAIPTPPTLVTATTDLGALARATAYVSKLPHANEGGRNSAAFEVAAALVRDFALSEPDALHILKLWNHGNAPPLDNAELCTVFENACRYGKNEVGSKLAVGSPYVNQQGLGLPAAAQPWTDIVSFDDLILPDFPTNALPAVLRDWVEAESYATQTPADLAGLLALTVCATTIARRVVVEPRPNFREQVNLFVAVLLPPGNRKSSVFADVMKPLRELEIELIEAARPDIARKQSERRQSEARLRKLEKAAAEKDDAEAHYQAGKLAAELAGQAEVVLPRLIVDDSTSEKLGMMLAEQGGRIASMSPEGGVFDLMAGMYSKSGIPQFGVYLMGHSGDDLITDRVSRKSVHVERPALTCGYAMQPSVIEGLAENPVFRGRGLLARFLYAAPKSWIGQREIATPPVPVHTKEAYHHAVRALADNSGNYENTAEPFILKLNTDAEILFISWETEIERMLGDGGDLEIMRDWGSKLAGATLRLAAVLHCVEHGLIGDLNAITIAAAIEIARYLIPHVEVVLNKMQATSDSTNADAQYVLRWMERHGRQEFTKRDAQQHGKRRFPKADDIDTALGELTRRGYIQLRPADTSSPGRPASPTYDVNPAAFAKGWLNKRSQNSQNSSDDPTDGGCENIENAQECHGTTERQQVTI